MTGTDHPKPKGFRRLERGVMSMVMGVIAYILEKVVMRSIRRDGGSAPAESGGAKVTSKGTEIDVDEG